MDQDYEMFKVVVIGSTNTGKTNISTRYIKNQFNEGQKATVGVEFLSKVVQVRNQNIKVTLWDTAGQERYKSLSKIYYKGASGVLIVYDITDPQSYLDVQSWMRLANENLNLNQVVLMVVGNKMDLQSQRRVPADRPIKEYKDKFDIDCWEVSAKTGYNVREVFAELFEKIFEKNIQIKSSVFLDASDYGGSIIDRNSTVPPPQPKKGAVMRQSYPQQVIQQNQDKQQQNQVMPLPPTVNKGKNDNKPAGQANRMTLTTGQQKKRSQQAKQKKQKKGCC